MANLTAASAAHKPNLPNRKGRKVVVEHEAFFGFAFEAFQPLHVVAGAESGSHQGLRFAAGEDSAAVGSGQHSGFDPDVANFVKGAGSRTALVVDDLLAEDALAQCFVVLLELL